MSKMNFEYMSQVTCGDVSKVTLSRHAKKNPARARLQTSVTGCRKDVNNMPQFTDKKYVTVHIAEICFEKHDKRRITKIMPQTR